MENEAEEPDYADQVPLTEEEKATLKSKRITQGDQWFATSNFGMMVCMCTLGVRPFKSRPIVKKKHKDGSEEIYFHLEIQTADKKFRTNELAKYWNLGSKFIEENTSHPFAVAMATLMNRKALLDLVKRKKATMEYKIPDGPTLWVTEGTKKHDALKAKYGY